MHFMFISNDKLLLGIIFFFVFFSFFVTELIVQRAGHGGATGPLRPQQSAAICITVFSAASESVAAVNRVCK